MRRLETLKQQLRLTTKAINHVLKYGQKKSIGSKSDRREIEYAPLKDLQKRQNDLIKQISVIENSRRNFPRV